jgi:hypothetical protein
MKFGLQIYAIIIPIEKSCITFNSNKVNSSQNMTVHKITDFYTKWVSVCSNIT